MKSAIIILSFLLVGIFFASSVFADPQIQVSSSVSPAAIAPGSDGYVQLTLSNTGTSAATSISVIGISSDPNLKVATSGIVNIGGLTNGQSTTALFKFSVLGSAPSGLYTIRFAINYCSTGCTEIDPTTVVTVQAPSTLQVVSITPDTLAAGQTSTLSFNIVNEGSDAVNNVILSWSTPNNEILPLGTSNRQYISSIEGETTMVLPVNVSVGSSVSPGVYPLTVQLSYHDKSGSLQNLSSSIGIKVGGTTDFDVAVQQYASGTLSLSVANIGVNPATSVSISIPAENNTNYAVTGASTSFLGTLNAGDFTVANFQIAQRISRTNGGTANSNTATPGFSNTPLIVEISYSDTSGARQVAQKEISVSISSQISGTGQTSRGFGLMNIILIVVIVVIVAGVLLWYFKFRKKKNFLRDFIAKRFKV